MKKMFIIALLLVAGALVVLATAAGVDKQVATRITDGLSVQPIDSRAACTMTWSSMSAISYWGAYEAGEQTVSYYDPEFFCTAPVYPFELTGFSFMLYDPGGGVWPANVDVVVYDAPDSCLGPGTELCRFSVVADLTYEYPNIGTATFPTPCCINGPVFIGLEYTTGAAGSTPSILFDDAAATDTCINWMMSNDGLWSEWHDFWLPPGAAYPMFWVDGETDSPNCPSDCDWQPGDPYKMHFPQLPDEAGWDVNATQPLVLADDWKCSETGWVKDFHFWGSWKNGIEGEILTFVLSIHSDIPADPPAIPYSRPGVTLWEREITAFDFVPIDPPSMEGWYDPSTGEVIPNDHQAYFQYNICLDEPDWFMQEEGTIYWVNISAIIADPTGTQWGWKSTLDHWNDDAVWAFWGELNWIDIWEPYVSNPIVNDFTIQIDPFGTFLGGGGGGAYGNGWYFYPMDEWWNIWFYDHPLDPERWKEGTIEFDVFKMDPGQPGYFEIAVNWSTDLWDPGDSIPPLPPVDELLYIGRQTLFASEFYEGHYVFDYVIPDYNPEWVSVDVRGYNFDIPMGIITHECIGQQSLDLSFVITGGPDVEMEACCFPDGSCQDLTPTDCQNQGGSPMGPGTLCNGIEACCLPDGSCIDADPLCCALLGGTPQGPGTQCSAPEACCLPDDSCIDADPLCCALLGGTPQGAGTQCVGALEACCLPDSSCTDADPICCINELGGTPQGPGTVCGLLEACCLPDNTCSDLDPLCCANLGGTPQGPGTACGLLEACCLPAGTCSDLDPLCCANLGGVPQGPGTACSGTTIACCFLDGSCQTVDPLCCDDLGGTPSSTGELTCLGDNNGNGVDDACELPGLKWFQPPDLDPTGMDVNATISLVVLADDYLCTQTGPITEIHIWGSWREDMYPMGDPGAVNFTLSIHSDIPVGPDGWSIPGDILWMGQFELGQFEFMLYQGGLIEGWYDPLQELYLPEGDTECWEYIFHLIDEPFIQQGTEEEPIVYWLDVQAQPLEEAYFGWKTSTHHWNDDAVWAVGFDPPMGPWIELLYPPMHPFEGMSIDLAFAIYGMDCPAMIGDANNSGFIDIDDVVYLINYIFGGGAVPVPYAVASGDADCSCFVDIDDVVYLINYIFGGGPPPCTCAQWVTLCGPLH
jgi:hypothetical protein